MNRLSDRVRKAAIELGTGKEMAELLAERAEKREQRIFERYVTKAAEIADGRKE